MKQDTQDMKPLRKLLKGKVPTRQQYTNWITPVRNTYNRYASIIFSFLGVFFVYSDQNLYSTANAIIFIDLDAKYYRIQMFENFSRIRVTNTGVTPQVTIADRVVGPSPIDTYYTCTNCTH